jgi:hypothetical protein
MTYSNENSYSNDQIPQKPVTDAMKSKPHGTHNYQEYRRVLTASCGSPEFIHYWAQDGVLRILHRSSSWFHAALRFNSKNMPEDEYEYGLDYLRAVDPILREFSVFKGTVKAFVLAVSDYSAIERLFDQPADADPDVLYWAQRGIIMGLESWRHMASLILTGKMQPIEMDIPCPDLQEFMMRSESLLKRYKTTGADQ